MAQKSTIVRIIQSAAPLASAVAPSLAARWLERVFLRPSRRSVRDDERAIMDAARRTSLPFAHGRALALYRWGDGPPVLLVHGWSGRASQLAGYVTPLVELGLAVVAFDAPAHGEAGGARTGLPELAVAVERVAEHTGPLAAVIAHSLGAAATTIAVARGAAVERLVYIAPPENPRSYLDRLAGYLGFSPPVARRTQRRVERRYGLRFEHARGGYLATGMRAPLLVMHDERDREVPLDEGRALVERWPGARLVTTRGLGHNRILRAPEVVRAAVAFAAGAERTFDASAERGFDAAPYAAAAGTVTRT